MNIKFQNINYPNFLTFLTLFAFFFMWDLGNFFFYIIILPITLIFFNKENYKIEKFSFSLLLLIYLIIVFLTLNPYKLSNISLNTISSLIGFFLVAIFCLFFRKEIIYNLKNLVLISSIIFFGLNVVDFIINYNLYNISDFNLLNFKRCHYSTGFFRLNIIFLENSHFGMVSVALSYYLLYLISHEKRIFLKIILFLIVLSFMYNSSTTYFTGLILSYFAIQLCCYKKINKQFFFLTTFFLIIAVLVFSSTKTCIKRFKDVGIVYQTFNKIEKLDYVNKQKLNNTNKQKLNNTNKQKLNNAYVSLNKKFNETYRAYNALSQTLSKLIINKDQNEIKIKIITEKLLVLENQLKKFDKEKFKLVQKNVSVNLTTQVYLRSFYILLESIKEKPFGWGLDNYYLASNEYRYKVPFINPDTVFLNSRDASNNFVKLIVEFGVFGLFLLILITFICLNQNIDHKSKIFFMPIIITQLCRGAGYFNGGFLIGICIIIILFIYKD